MFCNLFCCCCFSCFLLFFFCISCEICRGGDGGGGGGNGGVRAVMMISKKFSDFNFLLCCCQGEFTSGSLNGTGEVIFATGKCRKCLFKYSGIVKYLSAAEATADAALAYMLDLKKR